MSGNGIVSSSLIKFDREDVECLAKKNIFEGHQSVGLDIIEGLKMALVSYPNSHLFIKQTKNAIEMDAPLFAHFPIGKNGDPYGKIDDFKAIMDSGVGERVDIAFMKLCFVDVKANTDVVKLFDYYVGTMQYLEHRYPSTFFFHVTIPLMVSQSPSGPKAWFKRLLNKPLWGEDNNIARDYYNRLLRSRYEHNNRIFDIAAFEATSADGRILIYSKGRISYPVLRAEYTSDGAHLNDCGKQYIGEKFLGYLATIVSDKY